MGKATKRPQPKKKPTQPKRREALPQVNALRQALAMGMPFGKYRNLTVGDVVKTELGYLHWLYRQKRADGGQRNPFDLTIALVCKHYPLGIGDAAERELAQGIVYGVVTPHAAEFVDPHDDGPDAPDDDEAEDVPTPRTELVITLAEELLSITEPLYNRMNKRDKRTWRKISAVVADMREGEDDDEDDDADDADDGQAEEADEPVARPAPAPAPAAAVRPPTSAQAVAMERLIALVQGAFISGVPHDPAAVRADLEPLRRFTGLNLVVLVPGNDPPRAVRGTRPRVAVLGDDGRLSFCPDDVRRFLVSKKFGARLTYPYKLAQPLRAYVTDVKPVADAGGYVVRWPTPAEAGDPVKRRLEYLRGELRAERLSYEETHELQTLAEHIDPEDVELLEAAGVPEDKAARPAYFASLKAPPVVRYQAEFRPQAWVSDEALDTDAEGPTTWDCTAFVTAPKNAEYFTPKVRATIAKETHWADWNDVLRNDPAAPAWVRDWTGPFVIYVRTHVVPAEPVPMPEPTPEPPPVPGAEHLAGGPSAVSDAP